MSVLFFGGRNFIAPIFVTSPVTVNETSLGPGQYQYQLYCTSLKITFDWFFDSTYAADGNPCGDNGTFTECAFRCPNQFCPEDDSQVKVACKPGRPCPSGCGCKPYYLRKSYDDDTCILASDCSKFSFGNLKI